MTIPADSIPEKTVRSIPRAPLRIGVLGLGRSGLAHAAVLSTLERCSLAALVDLRSEARRNAAGLGLAGLPFATFDRMLRKVTPDAIFVCTPLASRAALAMRALESGAAVFVAHPIALDFDVTSRVVAEAERRGAPLLCSFPIVHQPVFARVLAEVAAGTLGEIRKAHVSLYVSRIFSAGEADRLTHGQGGGVLAHFSLDALFLVTRMLGLPQECEANAMRLYDVNEDELHARLRLASGTEISLDCSWSVPGYPRPGTVVELEGDRGHLLASDDGVEIDLAGKPHHRLVDADLPQPARFDLEGETRWIEDSAFVDWVLGGPAPPGAARDALDAHALMNSIQASVRAGGKLSPVAAEVMS
jgi:predicted dehydrogenase